MNSLKGGGWLYRNFTNFGLLNVLKRKTQLTQSKINMNVTKIIFSALHLHSINQNYMQCLGLGNRAEASLLGVNSPTVETINQKTNN